MNELFHVQNLEAGTYSVRVEQSGFRKYITKTWKSESGR